MTNENKPNIVHKINDEIMRFRYVQDISTDPRVHTGLNAFYLQMRQEVHNLQKMRIRARAEKIRELFIQDFLNETKELNEVDFAYINTQP